MSNPNSPEARKLAKELSDLRKLQKASHIAPRLPYSSVPEGNLVVTDPEGNVVDVVGSNPKDGQPIIPGPPPSKPSVPIVNAYLGTAQVSWDGLYVEDYIASDLRLLEVHGSSENEEFEPTSGTLLGTITNLTGGALTAGLDYGTWFFKLIAVTSSEARSVPSDASSCEVLPLVEAPDMVAVLEDIDARYDGVITEAGQLGARLDQAQQDLAAHEQRLADAEADLTNLNDVELVQLKASVDQAKLDLAQAQTDVANALAGLELTEADLANLKNVALPELQDTVTAAENRLATAEGEIVTSKNRLAEAESDLTDAFGQISAVDSKATTAINNASTAQSTADTAKTNAATAAGIAGGKADVLIQSTAPTTAMRKATTLWIDTTSGANTPKRWNGTAWVAVTDKAATDAATAAANAQSKAQEALTAAGSAQTTADSALTMAGSKTKSFYSTSAPSGTGTTVNDIWRRIDASKNVIGEWYWTGSSWQVSQITNEMISNLDVGKLTANTAIINTAVINKIAAQTATVIELNGDRITAGTVSADRINVTDLAARIATVIQLNADRIISGTIATGRLNATEVAAAVANVISLNASRITSGTISTARLNSTEIAAAVATIVQLNADRIVSGVISTDRLNANEIAARTAAFQQVDVKNLFVSTGTMSEAVINKLYSDVVMSKKITAQMLAIGDFENYATINPSLNLNVSIPSKWSTVTDGNYTRTAPTSENYLMFKDMDGPIPFQAGDKLRISFDAVADSADVTYSGRIWFYNSSGSYLSGFDASFSNTTITSTEKRFNGNLEIPSIPATASQYLIGISGTNIKTVKLRNVRALRMTAGELIVDGAVTATKIDAEAVTADKIKANAVTADKIDVGAVKARHILAGEITTSKLAITDFTEVAPSLASQADSWELVNNAVITDSTLSADGKQIKFTNTSGSAYAYGPMTPCQPNDKFYGSATLYYSATNTAQTYLRLYWFKKDKTASATPMTHLQGGSQASFPTGTKLSGSGVAPPDAAYVRIGLGVTASPGDSAVYNLSCRRMTGGELIVDGAITAKKIDTGAVTAAKIAANSITADKLLIGSTENLIPDPNYETTSAGPIWYAPASGNAGDGINTTIVQPSQKISLKMDVYPASASNVSLYGPYLKPDYRIPVTPGETYRITSWAYLDADSTGNMTSIDQRVYHFATRNGTIINGSAGAIQSSNVPLRTWFEVGGTFTVPAGSYFIAPRLTMYYPGNTVPTPAGASWYVSTPKIVRAASGELIVDGAIDGKTIRGANIIGSRYQFNGSGTGAGFNTVIDNDEFGAYMAWEIPGQVLPATIRAFDNDPWAEYSLPTLTLRPPSRPGVTDRDAVKISAGYDNGAGGLMDVIGNVWIRGELRGRYQQSNTQGYYASLAINDITNSSQYTGESPTIKSLGMYNRTYTASSNLYITTNGFIGRATSLREAKLVIEDIPQDQIDALLNVNPRWWFDKGESERLAEYLKDFEEGEVPENLKDVPTDLTRIPGLVAEEVEEAGATAFVTYDRDEDGNKKLSGVNYDRIGPALIPLVREQRDKIRDLEARLEALEARFQ